MTITKRISGTNKTEVLQKTYKYNLRDENGNIVGGTDELPQGYDSQSGKPLYYTSDKNLVTESPASVSLDKKTGKITINASELSLKNEGFKTKIVDTLKQLSSNYKFNPDYKYSYVDADGTNKTKTTEDIIKEINTPVNDDGTINESSIQYLSKAAESIEFQKASHENSNGVKLSDENVMTMNTVAFGDDVKDTSLQAISDLPEANFLRAVDTYNKETGLAQYRDLMDNAWNREKTSETDMIKLDHALVEYFKRGDFSDPDEYAKNVATYKFIHSVDPEIAWYRDAAETVGDFIGGILGFATDLGTAGLVAFGKAVDVFSNITGYDGSVTQDTWDIMQKWFGLSTENLSVENYGVFEPIDNKIGKIKVNDRGVLEYQEEEISGTIKGNESLSSTLRNIFRENQEVLRSDLQLLNDSGAAADMIGYGVAQLATLISAGNALSKAMTSIVGTVASAPARFIDASKTVNEMKTLANSLYVSGTALDLGADASSIASITNGMKTIFQLSEAVGEGSAFVNGIYRAVSSAKSTELLVGVVGESLAEAICGDTNMFVDVMDNNEIDDDAKTYLMQTYIGNARGWGVGIGTGKFLMTVGKTTRGRALSFNLSKRIFKAQNAVGDAFDNVLLKIRRVKGDTLADKIETLWEKGTDKSVKQANALASTQLLRNAREAVSELDSISIAGKTTEEIEEALIDAENKINRLKGVEVALDSLNKQGMDIVNLWIKDSGSDFGDITTDFYKKASELSKLERKSGDLFKAAKGVVSDVTDGKTIKLFSQTTSNYIGATEKLAIIDSYLEVFEGKATSNDILHNIEMAKSEREELISMIDKFNKAATPELKQAADNFIASDRKWWSQFEDLRARADNGLTNKDKLLSKRASGVWGEDGELYAKTTRKKDMSEYTIKHKNGMSDSKTFSDFEEYHFGASGDFVDPMGEMQIALYQAGSEKAYKNFVRSYDNITGAVNVRITGDQTDLADKLSKKMRDRYNKASKENLSSITDDLHQSKTYDDLINRLKQKISIKKDINKAKAGMSKASNKLSDLTVPSVTSDDAGRFIYRLSPGDIDDMYDGAYGVSVQEVLSTNTAEARRAGTTLVDTSTENLIKRKAEQFGISLDEPTDIERIRNINYTGKQRDYDRQLATWQRELGRLEVGDPRVTKNMSQSDIDKRMNKLKEDIANLQKKGAPQSFVAPEKVDTKSDILELYNKVNDELTNSNGGVDLDFERQVKRSLITNNNVVRNNEEVLNYLTEQRKMANEDFWYRMLQEDEEDLNFLLRQYDITIDEISAVGMDTVDGYVESMLSEGSSQKALIDNLCEHYGLTGDKDAARYFALSAYMDNQNVYKKALAEKINKDIENSMGNISKNDRNRLSGILTKNITAKIDDEYNNARLIIREINPDAVRADEVKIFDEVEKIADEIEGLKGNRYTGNKNIIAIRNNAGQVEWLETDKLLAGLVNFNPPAKNRSGLVEAMYNANYLWTKLFRLGTTSINIKSMISQSFRDPINMFVGGGAYRTSQQCLQNMTDVFGDDVVAYITKYEPEALAKLQRTSEATGESLQSLAVKRELELGRAIAPGATESNMYESLKTARAARSAGEVSDVYDTKLTDKITDGIGKVEDKLGKLNKVRETTLRNVSYANGLNDALERGYSLSQARTYATFVMNEATTNFGRTMNHLTSLQGTVPYLGAAINGSKSFWRLVSMDPVGVLGRLTGGIIIPTAAITAYSLSSEENREAYKNIPEYQKEDNIIVVANGQAFSIPIPQEFGSLIAPFRQVVESMYKVNTNTFSELAWNDILGLSPIELQGFADLDYSKIETSSPGFMDRIGVGITKLWSQLAPAPLKSATTLVTGIDPYTGKEIDTSYMTIDADGNPIVVDYQSGQTAKLLKQAFEAMGIKTSAPVIQNILSNIFGSASQDILDFLVSLGTAAVTTQGNVGDVFLDAAETLYNTATSPITVGIYNKAQSAWKKEVAKLYDMKKEILMSDTWSSYLKAKSNATSEEQMKNLDKTKKDLVENYFNTVKASVENLQNNYGAEFTAVKYATVLSLMTMDEQTLDAGSYGDYLNKEQYKTARAQAIQTMMKYGFESSSDTDILGKYQVSKSGDIYVSTNSPLAILQLDDKSGAKLSTQSNKQHFAVIKGLIDDSDMYDARSEYSKKISAASKEKDYKKAEELVNEYNEKLIRTVGTYIDEYGAESVLQGDALQYLMDYIKVPSSFEVTKKGKYVSALGNWAYKDDAFKEPYLKYIFNYGGNKL